MNEYVISFINDIGVYQQLSFRGVSEQVATGLATGLLAAGFQEVSLAAKEFVDREISILGVEAVSVPDPVEGASGTVGDNGAGEGDTTAPPETGEPGVE